MFVATVLYLLNQDILSIRSVEHKFLVLWFIIKKKSVKFVYSNLLNMQCVQNSAESGERSVLTLRSLCLPSEYARYSVKLIFIYPVMLVS